jgi:hypothetical protein
MSTAKHTRLKDGKGKNQNKHKNNIMRQLFTLAKKEAEMKTDLRLSMALFLPPR